MGLLGPLHRSILALDIERSTSRTNLVKFEQRELVYSLLAEAMEAAGIEDRHLDPLEDRGDGVLALMQSVDEVPRSRLLQPLIPVLARLLVEHNAKFEPEELAVRRLRLRAVVHAGDILHDDHGPLGADLDVAFRLLDSRAVRLALRETAAPLVLVVSDLIYESVVLHGYDGICPGAYRRATRVSVGRLRRTGWVHIPEVAGEPGVAA